MKNEKSSFEASRFFLFFFKGAGSNVCKLGDRINEREQGDKEVMGLDRGNGVG
jgi:hypothetical protein